MGVQEFKAWLYRQSNVPYIRAFWHDVDVSDFPEIGRKTVKDNGQMLKDFEDKPWHLNKASPYASKDNDNAPVLHFGVSNVPEKETMEPIPFLRDGVEEEVRKDHEFARSKGFVLDLAVFHFALGRDHTEGFFGRGRLGQFFMIIIALIIAISAVGAAAGYFGSQTRVVCVMPQKINGTYVPVQCPPGIFNTVSTTATSTTSLPTRNPIVTTSTTTTQAVSIPVVNGTG